MKRSRKRAKEKNTRALVVSREREKRAKEKNTTALVVLRRVAVQRVVGENADALHSFRQQLDDAFLHFSEGFWFASLDEGNVPGTPVQTPYLVGENDAVHLPGVQHDFKRIPFGLRGNGTHQREACFLVVAFGRHNHGRPLLCLLVSSLRIEVDPDEIAPVGNVRESSHHTSLPRALPHGMAVWRLSRWIIRTNSVSDRCLWRVGRTRIPRLSSRISTRLPSRSASLWASSLERRSAKLLPHL